VEASQRPGCLDRGDRCFDEKASRVRLPLPGDVAHPGRALAGLANARIEPEVADELPRRREALDVADEREQSERGDRSDPWDRDQPTDAGALKRLAR
jgi:hypothetical protein